MICRVQVPQNLEYRSKRSSTCFGWLSEESVNHVYGLIPEGGKNLWSDDSLMEKSNS